jgi:cytidylate kinase
MKIMLIAGHSAVGKTEAAKLLSKKLNLTLITERSILDSVVEKRGFNRIRDAVEKLGVEPILKDAREEAKNQILKAPADNIIFDGAYDGELVNFIKKNIPNAGVLVVGISANKTLRIKKNDETKRLAVERIHKRTKFNRLCKRQNGSL